MSIAVMSEVWNLDLDPSLKFTLLAFADYANDDGLCYPSKKRIGWKCGRSERTIQRHIQDLKDLGLLAVVEKSSGRGHTPTYRVMPQKGDKMSPLFPVKGDTVSLKGDNVSKKGDTGVSLTVSNRQGTKGGRTPARVQPASRRLNGTPSGPGDVRKLDQTCPEHGDPLSSTAQGPYCSACDRFYERG